MLPNAAAVRNEIQKVGLLPLGGDDNYTKGQCEHCDKQTQVITWEGVETVTTLCDDCWVELHEGGEE